MTHWTLVVPLKGGPDAKSRLAGPSALSRAIAADTLAAALRCPAVARTLVVTSDPQLTREMSGCGREVIPESRPGLGLLAAVGDGLRAVGGGPTAVLLGDLPALRARDLDAALHAVKAALDLPWPRRWVPVLRPAPHARSGAAFVPDADGSGTVLLAALDGRRLRPSFGADSASAHERSGALRLPLDLPRLRRDVDTREDLAAAVALGVGPQTAAALAGQDEDLCSAPAGP